MKDSVKKSQGWKDYAGKYTKQEYDIVSKGYVYFNCWPNSGDFHHLQTGHVIKGDAVELFKPSIVSSNPLTTPDKQTNNSAKTGATAVVVMLVAVSLLPQPYSIIMAVFLGLYVWRSV